MEKPLPEEILELIIGNLGLPSAYQIAERCGRGQRDEPNPLDRRILTSLSTLSKICMASKTLFRIAEPVLYRTFPGNWLVNTRLFVAALTSRPCRTTWVKEIVIDEHKGWKSDTYDHAGNLLEATKRVRSRFSLDDGQARYLESLYTQQLNALQRVIRRAPLPGDLKENLIELTDVGHIDAVLSVLVLLCSRVQALDLCCCRGFGQSQLQRTLVHPAGRDSPIGLIDHQEILRGSCGEGYDFTATPYSSLSNLSIRHHDWTLSSGLFGPINTLLRLPTLETVCLRQQWIVYPYIVAEKTRVLYSTSTMELNDCELSGNALSSFLNSCPFLISLKLTSTTGDNFANRVDIGNALRISASRLQHLVLEAGRNPYPLGKEHADGTTIKTGANIGGLKELRSLKRLAVTPWVILRDDLDENLQRVSKTQLRDVLPSGIQELTLLRSVDVTFYQTLGREEIAALQSSSDFPSLTEIRVDADYGFEAHRGTHIVS